MKKKTWYKPAAGSGIIKSGDLKNILKKSEDASLVECLYLDTADMALIKNGAVLMIADIAGELKQMTVFIDESLEGEYITLLPDSGIDLTLFPQTVYEKLCSILNGTPLQIQFESAFELKKRTLALEDVPASLLIRMLSHYEDNSEQRELCVLSIQSVEEDEEAVLLMEQLGAFTALTPCAPPYIEAMRLREIGCTPAADEKRAKKAASNATARLFGSRLFEMVKAYVGLATGCFDDLSVLKLRVASRKLITLIDMLAEVFGEKADTYKNYLNNLIDDTDELRTLDLISEEIDTVSSMHREFDFMTLKDRLVVKRIAICKQLREAYETGGYADNLAAFWVQTHKNMHEELINEDIIKATERIREWTVELNVYKKAELNDINNIHAYRKTARKLRYALESLSEVTVKRLSKPLKACKKLQDEFGMLSDTASYIKILQKLSAEENNPQLALLCGICCGVFAESLSDMTREAISVWKDCRNDLKALEDTL